MRETTKWADECWTAPGSRGEFLTAYADVHPHLLTVLDKVENCLKWGLFDRDPLADLERTAHHAPGGCRTFHVACIGAGARHGYRGCLCACLAPYRPRAKDIALGLYEI